MAFQIDPSIPLQAQRTTFDPASILMQAQQNAANLEKHRFEMQKLREDYDLAKEKRKQEKAMQMGMASDLARIESGSPAQYAPTRFEQTPQRGQMPQGMTGVMMREQGQQMPQPQAFGEEILNGDFRLGGGEVTQEAVAGRQPTYPEMLAIGLKQAMLTKNQDEIFKYAKAIQEAEKQAVKFGMNPTKGINPKTGQPDYFVVNELGQKQFLGVNPYETPKDVKTSLITTSQGYEVVKEGELPRGAPVVATKEPKAPPLKEITGRDGSVNIVNMATGEITPVLANGKPFIAKDDPLTLFTKKEEFKSELKQRETVAQKYADASDVIPLLDGYIADLEKTPANLLSSGYYKLKGLASTDNPELQAVAAANQKAKTLINYAQKQPGPSTDRDVMNYLEQVGVASDITQPRDARITAAKSAKAYAVSVQKKYGKYASRILNGEITPDELKQPSKPTRSKDELFRLYKEFKADYEAEKDPAMRKIMIDAARADGLIKQVQYG